MMQHASLFTVATLQDVARAANRSVAQVLLRWAVQKGVTVIPGTGNPSHMDENLAVHRFTLPDEAVASIDALRDDAKAKRFVALGFVRPSEE